MRTCRKIFEANGTGRSLTCDRKRGHRGKHAVNADARRAREQEALRAHAIRELGPRLLEGLDDAIEHMLAIYNGDVPVNAVQAMCDTNATLFDLMTLSRRARGLRPPRELPESWTKEDREKSG